MNTQHNTTIFMLSRSAFGFRSISKLVLAVCCATRWLILKLKFYLLLHKIQILFHSWLLMFGCCCCYCCISFLLVFSISFGAVMVVESKLALFFHSVLFFFYFSVHTELICIYECKTVYRFAFICRWRIAIRNWKANREYQCIVFAVKRDMWSPCFVVDVCRRFFSDIVISLLNCLCLFFLVVNCFFLLPNLSMYLYILHTWIFSVRPYVCDSIYDLDVRSFSHVVCIDF